MRKTLRPSPAKLSPPPPCTAILSLRIPRKHKAFLRAKARAEGRTMSYIALQIIAREAARVLETEKAAAEKQ